ALSYLAKEVIRFKLVTGVQPCALPSSTDTRFGRQEPPTARPWSGEGGVSGDQVGAVAGSARRYRVSLGEASAGRDHPVAGLQVGHGAANGLDDAGRLVAGEAGVGSGGVVSHAVVAPEQHPPLSPLADAGVDRADQDLIG